MVPSEAAVLGVLSGAPVPTDPSTGDWLLDVDLMKMQQLMRAEGLGGYELEPSLL